LRQRSCGNAPPSATPPPEPLLLEGIRVVEFATLIAGPFCGLTLSDLGADVVKLEPPRGDEGRAFRPFAPDGESAFFHALNRGKRSAVVDAAEARRLAERADVVIENAPDRLAFGPADMPERLVWCSITGQGPGRGRAMDPSLQAKMGLMALTGERDGPPLRVPVPLIDFMTGMYAAQSVLAALWQAERSGTGAHLDCALLDSAATLTSTVALFSLSGEFEPSRIGTESYLRVPSAVFRAADGEHVQVIALHEGHWEALCSALGRPEWVDDPQSAGNDARLANRELVNDRIAGVIATAPADTWVERINAAGGMCERLRGLGDAWRDPLLADRGLVGELDGGPFDYPLPVISLARPSELVPGPKLGQHTAEVLGEL
jgi:crotonobetainyl-CoA:carnitine CoA-transferase CaiB-like acyl-CoA transferase